MIVEKKNKDILQFVNWCVEDRNFEESKIKHLPAVRETSILLVVAKCVPKSQGNIHVVDHLPRAF